MASIRIVDIVDQDAFALVPLCADPSFDHRTCDYWEDAVVGSKARRESWLRSRTAAGPGPAALGGTTPDARRAPNPFLEDASRRTPAFNPFATGSTAGERADPFAATPSEDRAGALLPEDVEPDLFGPIAGNPFAPPPRRIERPDAGAHRKLGLLGRGLGVFGSYGRVLLLDGRAVAYCQFGPLSAYPRALQLRDLYPQLPSSPLPAVITCIATTADARRRGHAIGLVDDACRELARRGFAAVETYPEARAVLDATSTALPAFWERAGFAMVVPDEQYPVMRREL